MTFSAYQHCNFRLKIYGDFHYEYEETAKQAGAELGQDQLKIELEHCFTLLKI